MTTEPPPLTASVQASPRAALARVALAWLLTLGVLPYAWGRTLIIWMMVGRPELPFVALLVVGLAAVILLNRGRASELAGVRGHRLLGPAVAVTWAVTAGVLVLLFRSPTVPAASLLLLFIPATLWVAWAAWMFYRPMHPATRWGVLLLLAALAVPFPLLLDPELAGDARVAFHWRRPSGEPADLRADPQAAGDVDLSRTSPDDYPQFLGPLRLGVQPAARLARDWQANPPRLLWRQPIGEGWSGFAVVGDYAVTQEQRGPRECVVCYRLRDGAVAWAHADDVRFDSSMGGPGPRATPTVADGRVYTVGATGLLNCLDGATGRALWSVDMLRDNDAENIAHGVAGSPLLVGDLVVVCPTGSNGLSLAAYHRDDGRRVWRGGRDQASYGSPLLAELDGVRQILLFNSAAVAGHDPASGEVLWRFPWTNHVRVNVSQPIPNAGGDGRVFVGTGYGQGSALFQVRRDAQGTWGVRTLWERPGLKTKFTTAVLHRGHLYGLDDGVLECLDLETGKRRWKEGRYRHGQVLLAGDLLLVQAEDGEVVLIDPVPDGLRELGRLPALDGKTWNNPALAGPYLLVRNDREAACYELPLRREQAEAPGAARP